MLSCSREEQTLESLQSAGTKNYRLEEVPRWTALKIFFFLKILPKNAFLFHLFKTSLSQGSGRTCRRRRTSASCAFFQRGQSPCLTVNTVLKLLFKFFSLLTFRSSPPLAAPSWFSCVRWDSCQLKIQLPMMCIFRATQWAGLRRGCRKDSGSMTRWLFLQLHLIIPIGSSFFMFSTLKEWDKYRVAFVLQGKPHYVEEDDKVINTKVGINPIA